MQFPHGKLSFAILASFVLSAVASYGQQNVGQIMGTVRDSSGAVIPNAQVSAKLAATGTEARTVTNSEGAYVFPELEIGNYDLGITAAGFSPLVDRGVRVISSVTTTADIVLQVGNATQTVSVSARTEGLDTISTDVGTTRTVEEISQLPLLLNQTQRSAVSFARTFPGVSWTPGAIDDGSQGINVAIVDGAPEGGEGFMIDGIPASISGHGQLRDDFSPPPEMIREMSLTSNPATEYAGWNSGVEVALVTTGGTNELHGVLFENLRNTVLDAKNYYAAAVSPEQQNEFGFTVGGPVMRNKLFFFGMFSGYRLRFTPQGVIQSVPTAAMRTGNFSQLLGAQIGTDALNRPIYAGEIYDPSTTRTGPGGSTVRDPFTYNGQLNVMNPAEFSPISTFFQSGYPLPTQSGTSLNWTGQVAPSPVNSWKFNTRFDYNINNSQTASFAYEHWWRNEYFGAPFAPLISNTYHQSDDTYRIRASYQWTIRPNLLFSIHGAINKCHDELNEDGLPSATGGQQAGLTGLLQPNTPLVTIASETGFGPPYGGYINEPAWMTPVFMDLTWVKGMHSIKFGVQYTPNVFVTKTNSEGAGQFTFSQNETGLPGAPAGTGFGYASYLLGTVDSAVVNTPEDARAQSNTWGFYAQDSWKVASKLVLSYGLRWDIFFPEHVRFDEIGTFDPTAANPTAGGILGALQFWGNGAGRNGRSSAYQTYLGELSPRFGFVYNVIPSMVVRGGFGLSSPGYFGVFDSGDGIPNYGWSATITPASLNNGVTPAFNWSSGFPNIIPQTPSLNPSLLNGSNVNYLNYSVPRPGRTENVNFGLGVQLPGRMVVGADYIGSFSRGLALNNIVTLNELNPTYLSLGSLLLQNVPSTAAAAAGITPPYPGFTGSVAQALRPYPQYQTVNQLGTPYGFDEYNALQITVQKHSGSGLSFLANYTISKEMANHSNFNGQGQGNVVLQYWTQGTGYRQLADLDRPQMFQVSALYELPFGPGKPFLNNPGRAERLFVGGWQVATVGNYMSGTPVALSTNQSLVGGYAAVFANRVPGVPIKLESCSQFNPSDPSRDHYLNVAAFSDPAPFSFGTTRVLGNIRTCGYTNQSISAIKFFTVTERIKARLAFDFNNAFNWHSWQGLNSNIDVPSSFGQFGSVALGVTGAGGANNTGATAPRQIQASLKIIF